MRFPLRVLPKLAHQSGVARRDSGCAPDRRHSRRSGSSGAAAGSEARRIVVQRAAHHRRVGARRVQGGEGSWPENRVHFERQRDPRGARLHPSLDRLLQDRLQSDGRSSRPRAGRRAAARARCDPHGVRAGILARARDPRSTGVQRRRRPAQAGRRLYRVGEPRKPVARDGIPQGLPHDRPRQHVGGNPAAGVRDRGGGRPQVRVCGQSSGPGRTLGAYVVPRLRRVADRAPWLCDSATADRRGGRLRRLRPANPGRVVVGLLLVALQGAGVFDPLVEAGIRRGAYPGAALIVGRRDTILFAKGYGHLTWSASSPAVDPDSTMYDLASLTKVVATTTSLMLLVERGQVRLDEPVSTYIARTDVWRGHTVEGTVHDGSAFKLRGVSGNGGLFATAADMARLPQFVL